MNDFLDIAGLGPELLTALLDLSERPAASLGRPLDGRGVALIFEKPSNRTRHSTEMAVVQLGGHPVYTRGEEIGFDVREPVEDIARIMAGYHAVIAARVFAHRVVERLADASPVPVVNLLSDHSHPLQGLADALTMRQALGDLTGRTMAFVGDFANVTRSLAEIGVSLGMRVRLGCPAGYDASADELERIAALGPGSIEQSDDPYEAVRNADVVHTDTWTSMGREAEKEHRAAVFAAYQVDEQLMAHAAQGAWFMHCLPAYRGLEVAAEVIDGPRSLVIAQGHNRMHTARAVLAVLAGVAP